MAKGQWSVAGGGLRRQGVEQFGRSEALVFGLDPHLFFLDHVHEFDPDEGRRAAKGLEPQHRPGHPLHRTMILFHDIVEILDLADGDRRAVLGIVALDGRFIGRAPVNGDLLRHAVAADRLGQKALGGPLVALLGEQEIDGLAVLSTAR